MDLSSKVGKQLILSDAATVEEKMFGSIIEKVMFVNPKCDRLSVS